MHAYPSGNMQKYGNKTKKNPKNLQTDVTINMLIQTQQIIQIAAQKNFRA
jgi:hypothetical protein